MAELVYHLNTSLGQRSKGRCAVKASAYICGERLEVTSERAQTRYNVADYQQRDDVLFAQVMAPKGAPRWMKDREKLWNAVEDGEIRKDAQLFRQFHLALPHMLSPEAQNQLVQGFIQQHFVSRGFVAEYAIHKPGPDSDPRHFHAHIMVTMRKATPDGFEATKDRSMNKKDQLKLWRKAWADEVNMVLAAQDETKEFFIDHRSYKERGLDKIPTKPLGVRGSKRERANKRNEIAEFNAKAREYNLGRAVANLAQQKSVFKVRDLRTALLESGAKKHVEKQLMEARAAKKQKGRPTEKQIERALNKFLREEIERLKSTELVGLRVNGRYSDLYTTQSVRATEESQISVAKGLVSRKGQSVSRETLLAILENREGIGKSLFEDQEKVLRYVTSEGGFKVVEGLAGTGKSFTMSAIRDAFAQEKYRVVGLSHTNSVVDDMRGDGFKEAYTISKFLYDLKKPDEKRTLRKPDKNTVLMVDEAAMLSLKQDGKLFDLAKKSGAKLVYVGDSGQLQSIDAGGMFGYYAKLARAARLTTITRQHEKWDRAAAMDFAQGRFFSGLLKYKKYASTSICPATNEELAINRLVQDWIDDTSPARFNRQKRFVFAYTNAQCNELNDRIHRAEIENGIIDKASLQTFLCDRYGQDPQTGERKKLGTRSVTLGVKSRIQFRQTDKRVGVINGSMGTVTGMEGELITVRLDKPGTRGQVITINKNDYSDFDLGYAGTIYKGQGKTFDQAYVMFSKHWRRDSAYVAMTRSRKPTKLYYARNQVRSLEKMAAMMARTDETVGASLAFSTASKAAPSATANQVKAAARRSWLYSDFRHSAKAKAKEFWRIVTKRTRDKKKERSKDI